MSTSIKKSLTYGKNYSFDVKANGYYDYLETKSITKETEEPINITLKEYDGLKYTVDKSSDKGVRLNFANTVLPYVSDNKLQKTDYCLTNVGQQINFGSAETEEIYENISITKSASAISFPCTIENNVISASKPGLATYYSVLVDRPINDNAELRIAFENNNLYVHLTMAAFKITESSTSSYAYLTDIKHNVKITSYKFEPGKKYYIGFKVVNYDISVLVYPNGYENDYEQIYTYTYSDSDFGPNHDFWFNGKGPIYLDESYFITNNNSYKLSAKITQPKASGYSINGTSMDTYLFNTNPVKNGIYDRFLSDVDSYVDRYISTNVRLNKDENIFILFTTGLSISGNQMICKIEGKLQDGSVPDILKIYIKDSKLMIYTGYNEYDGVSAGEWNLGTLNPNTGYRIKLVITDSNKITVGFALIDEHSYDNTYITTNVNIPSNGTTYLGDEPSSADYVSFKGSIDFKNIPGAYEIGTVDNVDGCIDLDITYVTGTNATFNCFANKNTNILLTDKDSYEDYRYLGKVEIRYPDPALKLVIGDRIDNKATVIGNFTDSNNQEYVVAVLDTAYHGSSLSWSNEAIDSVLPNYKTYDLAVAAKESATYNMNQIETNYDITTYPAFNHCKTCTTVTFNKKEYTPLLPNAAEVEMINTNWNLVQGTSASRLVSCWSSTEKHTYAWRRTADAWYNSLKTKTEYTVIPIIEIPIKK